MQRQVVVYLDTCVFSNLLKPEHKLLLDQFVSLPHRFVFSHVHLQEMQGRRDDYANLLCDLDAVFVRNPGETHDRLHDIASLEAGDPFTRLAEQQELSPAYEALEAILQPMHFLLGGQADDSQETVAASVEKQITASLNRLLSNEPETSSGQSFPGIEEATATFLSTNSSEPRDWFKSQVAASRKGDAMKNMQPLEKVQHIFSFLSPYELKQVTDLYPENFACKKTLGVGELAGFALMLFAIGLTKRRGVFNGRHQDRKFAAQFRDTAHIEAACCCDVFLTADQGASELATATYAYAGFPVQTVLLTGT